MERLHLYRPYIRGANTARVASPKRIGYGLAWSRMQAAEQCVAADEAGASDGASQLNAVFDGRLVIER